MDQKRKLDGTLDKLKKKKKKKTGHTVPITKPQNKEKVEKQDHHDLKQESGENISNNQEIKTGKSKKKQKQTTTHANSATKFDINEQYGFVDCDPTDLPIYNGHEICKEDPLQDSVEKARKLFEWMIAPVSVEQFYLEFWEKKPLIIKRHTSDYYDGWFSKSEIDKIIKQYKLEYGKNLDITKYENYQRKTLNPKDEKPKAETVWKFFEEGCSVRMLHPQQYCEPLWTLVSVLEEFWGCAGGCNSYLTPKDSQGFAPHYDDVEAFVLQLEGSKSWRLYPPRNNEEILPRFSSKNFNQNEIGKPMIEVIVECGDLVYFPRGTIHQAVSVKNQHSLHITLSTGLKNSYFDFLEIALGRALQLAFDENVELRKSIPRDFMEFLGVVNADRDDPRRQSFMDTIYSHCEQILQQLPFDATADHISTNFIAGRMPSAPLFKRGIVTKKLIDTNSDKNYNNNNKVDITVNTKVGLVTKQAARLLIEDNLACLYTHGMVCDMIPDLAVHNQREFHANSELEFLNNDAALIEFPIEYSTAIEYLIVSFPEFVAVQSIPLEKDDDKVAFAKRLFLHGVISIEPKIENEQNVY